MTNEQKPRDPFEFYESPWWKDMNNKLCVDGWPQVVVSLNCMVREAKKAYQALEERIKELEKDIQLRKESYFELDDINTELNDKILALSGRAAVNFSEPCSDDLKRLSDENKRLVEENKELKSLIDVGKIALLKGNK